MSARRGLYTQIELDAGAKAAVILAFLLLPLVAIIAADADSTIVSLDFTLSYVLLTTGLFLNGGQLKVRPKNGQRTGDRPASQSWLWVFGALGIFGFAEAFVPLAFGFVSTTYLSSLSLSSALSIGGLLAIINAISEESFFRYGITNLFTNVGPRPSVITGIVMSAAAFTLYHAGDITGIVDFSILFVAGLTLAFIGLYTGRLSITIISHVANNLSVFLFTVLLLKPQAVALILPLVNHLI